MSLRKFGQLVKEKPIFTFIIGAIIGLVAFLMIYGVDVLLFTNVNWLTDSESLEGLWDLTQHYNGWLYYRQTPWTFPIGMTENVCPEPISVAYMDSIPLFAIIFKVLSPILPATFQYFGLFELLTYMLMGGFGSLITYKYSKNVIFNSISAGLFVVSPVLIKRTFYHTALSAHFLILIAICLWIYREEISYKKYVIYWTLLGILCVLINPYYVPMVFGIMLCSVVQEIIEKKVWKRNVLLIIAPIIGVIFVGWIIGLFAGSQSASGDSLEIVSYNLNQFFNPADPVLHHDSKGPVVTGEVREYSKFIDPIVLHTGWQMEGFSYLGLGIIIMMIVSVIVGAFYIENKVNKNNIRKLISIIISVLIGVVVFTLLAMGPVGSYGESVLYHIKWPQSIYNLFAMFRTCGRLIWPVYYGVYTIVLLIFAKTVKGNKWIWLVVIVCTVIQLLDISPSLTYKRKIYSNIGYNEEVDVNPLLSSEIMKEIAQNHDEIVFLPETRYEICLCGNWSCKFQQYALENNMKMSAAYCSRDVSVIADEYANDIIEKKRNGESFPNVIYVVMFEKNLDRFKDLNIDFFKLDDVYIGVER